MKIIKNEKLIKRNGKIGQWSSMAGLAVLAGGMYISFQRPELFSYSLVALLAGFTLTQISMYYGNRFGRSPRPDEKLDSGLKGLPGEFALYHFITPAAHFLVSPAGLWVLMPFHQRGQVTYRNNRWRLSGGGFLQGYLRIFGQEGLGRPELDAEHDITALNKFLSKKMTGTNIPEIRALMVFTSDDVEINAEEPPLPAMKLKQLKEFMRQKAKEKSLGALMTKQITDLLPES